MSYGTDLFPSMLPCLCVCTNAIRHTLEQKSFIIILPSFPTIKIASHDADNPSDNDCEDVSGFIAFFVAREGAENCKL